jgi:hypothetical protein
MMRALLLASLVAIAVAAPPAASAQSAVLLEGEWEGLLEVTHVYGVRSEREDWFLPNRTPKIRLDVRGAIAHLRLEGRTIMRGGFRVETHDAAALVFAIGVTDYWIETWQLSITKTGADTALIYLWRVVNNTQRSQTRDMSKFAWGAVGEIKRVPEN